MLHDLFTILESVGKHQGGLDIHVSKCQLYEMFESYELLQIGQRGMT